MILLPIVEDQYVSRYFTATVSVVDIIYQSLTSDMRKDVSLGRDIENNLLTT